MYLSNEEITLYVLGFVGIAIDILFKLKEWIQYPSKRPNVWIVAINILISIIITISLIHIRADISSIYVITPIGALILGYMAHTLFRKMVSIKSKETKNEE